MRLRLRLRLRETHRTLELPRPAFLELSMPRCIQGIPRKYKKLRKRLEKQLARVIFQVHFFQTVKWMIFFWQGWTFCFPCSLGDACPKCKTPLCVCSFQCWTGRRVWRQRPWCAAQSRNGLATGLTTRATQI